MVVKFESKIPYHYFYSPIGNEYDKNDFVVSVISVCHVDNVWIQPGEYSNTPWNKIVWQITVLVW